MADKENNSVPESKSEEKPGPQHAGKAGSQAPEEVQPAVEATEPPPPDVVNLCRDTFKKTAEYLRGELEGTIEDYKLLEKMNKVTVTKYSEMKHIAMNIGAALEDLNEKYKGLQPYLDQIDQIEESVAALEQAAYNLDHYSKRLESKFKALEKR